MFKKSSKGWPWPLVGAIAIVAMGLVACGGSSSDPIASVEPSAPAGPSEKWGYITLPDGNKMRYSLLLPEGKGPFPVLVEYDGYWSGSYPYMSSPWVAEGYAVMGLSAPGSGCSTGDFQWADESTGKAGAYAIEWAAQQSWSTGRIGMIGYSYSGYSQLWVAAQRPKGLVAITPGKTVTDVYRDVAQPGGIANIGFPSKWWSGFPTYWQIAVSQAQKYGGDTECAKVAAENINKIKRPEVDMTKWLEYPYIDDPADLSTKRSARLVTSKINVPMLATQAWQDDQTGSRAGYYEDTIDSDKLWLLNSNGDHHTNLTSAYIDGTLKRFLARYVKGEANGFEKEPRVRLLQEMQSTDQIATNHTLKNAAMLKERAVADLGSMPVKVKPMRLWMQADGGLSDIRPQGQGSSTSYRYPVEGSMVNNPVDEGWKATATASKDGVLSFTTAALPEALSFYGEGSADIWLSTTATNTDLQVTVSEVRSDGQEMFVQRGWLRASKHALDEGLSTVLRPWGMFTSGAEKALVPGEPVLARVEINKFAHVFRAGSSIRVTIDTPAPTGHWVFGNLDTPSSNTVWHDAQRPSSVVLGFLSYAHAPELPNCEKTFRQPCRPNVTAVPAGTGPRAPI